MTPLTQQLEDKKKGCGRFVRNTMGDESIFCGVEFTDYEDEIDDPDLTPYRITKLCDNCKSNIAILEQAIAEKKKQRQEILKLIKQEISKDAYSYTFECRLNNFLKNGLKQQLNQPKTEKENSK